MLTSSSIVTSLRLTVPMYCPSRMTEARSQMRPSSAMRWLMYTMPTPFACRRLMISNSWSISRSVRVAVGSSSTRILELKLMALAISTICCWATLKSPTRVWVFRSMPSPSRIFLASRCMVASSMKMPFLCARPMKMLSATLRWPHMFSSCMMMEMPSSWALATESMFTFLPSMKISPSSAW